MQRKTVFVIGAGASHDFGLPLGYQLKDAIANDLDFRFDGADLQHGNGTLLEAIDQKYDRRSEEGSNAMLQSRRIARGLTTARSIDNFIHQHRGNTTLEFLGKLAIAHRILFSERDDCSLYTENSRRDPINFSDSRNLWINELFMLITETAKVDELKARFQNLTFVIFNYDRCLEHALKWALINHYDMAEGQAEDLVRSLTIYHPYGTVGVLPWMQHAYNDGTRIEFGGEPNANALIDIASSLRTFTEGTDPHDSRARQLQVDVSHAQQIIFLGFAYHPMNLDILFDPTLPTMEAHRQSFGTSVGISSSNLEVIQDLIDEKGHISQAGMRFYPGKSKELLAEYQMTLISPPNSGSRR